MKRKILLTLAAGFTTIAILNSNSSGPAANNNGNRTGGPNSLGTCAGCHGGGSGNTTATITLRKKSDNSAATSQYNAGATYIVRIEGTHPSLGGFGFQMMAVKSGNTQAGTFTNLGSNYHVTKRNNIEYVEQHHTLSKTGNDFVAEFEWVAPVSGTGKVDFHGVLNAVNGDGNTSGDAVSNPVTLSLNESPTNIETVENAAVKVYPNPASDVLSIDLGNAAVGTYTYSITDLNGRVVMASKINMPTQGKVTIPVAALENGIYAISITNGTVKQSASFIKQ